MKNYSKNLLEIDLTSKTVITREISEDVLRQYIGGTGLSAKILMDKTGPDNPVYICIDDDIVEIRHAGDLWGKYTYELDIE